MGLRGAEIKSMLLEPAAKHTTLICSQGLTSKFPLDFFSLYLTKKMFKCTIKLNEFYSQHLHAHRLNAFTAITKQAHR